MLRHTKVLRSLFGVLFSVDPAQRGAAGLLAAMLHTESLRDDIRMATTAMLRGYLPS